MKIQVDIKRAYDKAQQGDGYRVLVDRLWPRGVSKEELHYDAWCKDLAPSPALRKWFGHKVEHWDQFRDEYETELRSKEQEQRMRQLVQDAGASHITLVYGARDTEHNHAIILAAEIERVARHMGKTPRKQG
ncbi:DUF488 domain-containing protein [Pusillimonas noertemannii]|uniref:Uncharacterized protein YeaO (DUF488 family) n=2 Tax=Pusillimonas noertemannii TaxID=305977 RepID=A0A2U1CHA3_9BURK|nr:DUF488 family protein [Pusillimonas noertemannii]NYT70668.1 DUF488 family protein [Pusillimonas noertemannii]PVY60279.1 uncharacterized protein YeaO (DUF488 family) [Pusillimonas noertemannii]TFL07936.1 DUF488 family protein [Pusillimonas noertemannii]